MNPFSPTHPARAAITVVAIALIGVVVAPVTAAHAEPTAWTCPVDTFVWRTGTLNQAVVTTGIPTPTAGPALTASPATVAIDNLNAIALHPLTGIVYANDVRSDVGNNARVINPDGTVEDVSTVVPFTNDTSTATYAGGTFTADGYWLLADSNGKFSTVDLTDPLSPTYGEVVFQGNVLNSAGGVASRWLSGDMAYRASDDRVYFTTWNSDGFTTQVGSIPRAAFFGTADIVPDFGPLITVPGGANTSGAASGFDSDGNLWMSTNLITDPATVPAEQSLWRLDAAALTGTDPIVPAHPINLLKGSGTDGFMCPATPTPLGEDDPVTAGAPTLAATGPTSGTIPVLGGGIVALLAGAALMAFAARRRRHA